MDTEATRHFRFGAAWRTYAGVDAAWCWRRMSRRARQPWRRTMLTRTCTILSAAILVGTASAALAMAPTGHSYKPFPHAYASTETAQPRAYGPSQQMELADRQSFFYRR